MQKEAAVVEDLVDPRRSEPEFILTERAMLEAWLEFHRTTLELKTEGLSDLQRKSRPVASSRLSLHGLVRHMAEVERNWFRPVLGGEPMASIFAAGLDWEPAFSEVAEADVATAFAAWEAECSHARELVAAAPDLDATGDRDGKGVFSLRWVLIHMIEEYARHNGHADLIRELVDGAVGW